MGRNTACSKVPGWVIEGLEAAGPQLQRWKSDTVNVMEQLLPYDLNYNDSETNIFSFAISLWEENLCYVGYSLIILKVWVDSIHPY